MTVHEEKLIEEERLRTRQLRHRIPTEELVILERQSNMGLGLLLGDERLKGKVRAYVEWELDYRRAHAILKVDTFDERGAVAIDQL